MIDCRYYDLCCFTDDSCNGEQECPKRGTCQFYIPMPDRDALLELADGLDDGAEKDVENWAAASSDYIADVSPLDLVNFYEGELQAAARRIREALGVES